MKHVKYPKTVQFRNVVTTIINRSRFIGKDEHGEPIYDDSLELPVIKMKGTIKLHGCLHAKSKILLWDGSYKTIKEIVENKLKCDLVGLDENNKIVKTKILNHFDNGLSDNWLSLNFTRKRIGRTSFSSIKCTPNHKFFNLKLNEYIEASNLKEGDEILMYRRNKVLSFAQKEILKGKMLGDGTLSNDHIEFRQLSDKYVFETLENLTFIAHNKTREFMSGYGSKLTGGRTIDKFYIKELFDEWYINKIKEVPKDINLSPISLAYWYMDDGSLSTNDKQQDRVSFATCGFNEKSIDNLINALKKINLKASKIYTDNKYWRINLNTRSSQKLLTLIAPYILNSMQYKLPLEFRGQTIDISKYSKDEEEYEDYVVQEITNITKGLRGETNKRKYDIETDTHNFFANDILVHNSNAGIGYNLKDGLYTQSKNNVLTLDKTSAHFGFTFFIKKNEEYIIDLIKKIAYDNDVDLNVYTITVYGEWCGPGVQKNVAISEVEKSLYVFGTKVSKEGDEDFKNYWLDVSDYRFDIDNLYNINEFKTYEMIVDFNNTKGISEKFIEIIDEVENECPVAKQLGVSGIGEGVVWEFFHEGERYIFKTKGELHSKPKPKSNDREVDSEKINEYISQANKLTPNWRLEQMFNEVTSNGRDINRKYIGNYINLVISDIIEEDIDIVKNDNIDMSLIKSHISKICRDYFFMMENEGL